MPKGGSLSQTKFQAIPCAASKELHLVKFNDIALNAYGKLRPKHQVAKQKYP